MNIRHILIGAIVLAAALLGGLWLFLEQLPSSKPSAFQQKCVQDNRAILTREFLKLHEGATPEDIYAEDIYAGIASYCGCLTEEVGKRLSAEELAAFGFGQAGAEVSAKLEAAGAYCRDRSF